MTVTAAREHGGDLTPALTELHRLLLGYQSLDLFLRNVAVLAAETVAAGLGCVIMAQPTGHGLTVATSDELASLACEEQYRLGQGPSLRCLRWQHPVHIGDLAEDAQWPVFARHAVSAGIRSCLCLPLKTPGMTGAMCLYAAVPHAFGAAESARAATFAGYVSGVLVLALRQDGFVATIGELRGALVARTVVDQAVGVIMGRRRCSGSEALAMLRHSARSRDIGLHELARQIVAEASTRPAPAAARPAGARQAAPPQPARPPLRPRAS
jgi:GAF domain-containing protein